MDLTGRTIEQIRFDALIGRGGMGAVYRGFDLRLKRPVAVKVLRDHSRRAPEARGRFMREARLLSRLDHPGICRVYDLIVRPGGNLLVLELIRGRTLRELGASSWPLDRQLAMARDIADALAAAHRQLVLHRDLKPDNVMLTEEGQVKLLDFGIARPLVEEAQRPDFDPNAAAPDSKAAPGSTAAPGSADGPSDDFSIDPDLEDDEITLFAGTFKGPDQPRETPPSGETFHTLRGATVGTVAYMSPEQALGHPLTVASDMYAFGVLLQEVFTGKRAYPKATLLELFQRVARAETEPIEGLDLELHQLIRELQSQAPGERPSAEEARDRLRLLIDRPTQRRRRRRRLASAAAALLLVAATLTTVVHSRLESRRQAAQAERFAQQASAVEWLLRAEHLSPTHDVTPARQRVEAQLARLAAELPQTRRLGRAAGSYALGRAHLALDEPKAARRLLQEAWDGGYRLPEVESYLGLAMLRLYSLESDKARRIPSTEQRQSRLEALDAELRLPGVERLKQGRFDGGGNAGGDDDDGATALLSIEPRHYPQALVALQEDRLDEALEQARLAAEKWPWFYEAVLLQAEIELQRALDLQAEPGLVAQEALERARGHAERSAEAARSDPRVATEQCRIEMTMLDLESTRPKLDEDSRSDIFRRGEEACRRALDIDPRAVQALTLTARLMQRAYETGADIGSEEMHAEYLGRAAKFARRALDIDDGDATAWKSLGDTYSMLADWQFFHGEDATAALGRMEEAYGQAVDLLPDEGRYVNALGNAKCFRAEMDEKMGRDPRAAVAESTELYKRSDLLSGSDLRVSALVNLALCTGSAMRYQLDVGIDPAPRIAETLTTLETARERDDSPYRLWREFGEIHTKAALTSVLKGEDPAESIVAARAALERANATSDGDIHTWTSLLRLESIAALVATDAEDRRRARQTAERWAARILEDDPDFQQALVARGELPRLIVAAGGTVSDQRWQEGRKDLESVLVEDPTGGAWLELGRLELALSTTRAGEERERALARAGEAFGRAVELWPNRPDVYLALAALDGPRAEEMRQKAFEMRSGLTDESPPAYWLDGATVEGQVHWPP